MARHSLPFVALQGGSNRGGILGSFSSPRERPLIVCSSREWGMAIFDGAGARAHRSGRCGLEISDVPLTAIEIENRARDRSLDQSFRTERTQLGQW